MKKKLTWTQANRLIAENTEEVVSSAFVKDPVATVSVVTYNHAKYIAQALESVLDQDATFPFEIVVGDDCSTDGTSDIVREYQKAHPDKIRLLYSTKRLGQYTGNGRLNLIRNFNAARGKYFALLEGDDFWCCPSKLGHQVGRFQADDTISLLCHRVKRVNEIGYEASLKDGLLRPEDLFPKHTSEMNFTWETFMQPYQTQTCSIMLSRHFMPEMPQWILNLPAADSPICIQAATVGKVIYEPDVRAVYRRHTTSYWSSTGLDFRRSAGRVIGIKAFRATAKYQHELDGQQFWNALKSRLCNGSVSNTRAMLIGISNVSYVPAECRTSFLRSIFSWYRFTLEQKMPALRSLPTIKGLARRLFDS